MNFNRILVLSFLVLVISTYQTDSGIIISLLLKILLLKGALFMSMPLTIGSFMMGQGMGFFAGNMMGGYMMLRAANKYHHVEKGKWMGYGEAKYKPHLTGYGTHTDLYKYTHQTHKPLPGWGYEPSHNFQHAYDKGKDIGSAIAALKAHKLKLSSAIHHIKASLASKKPGWGWPQKPVVPHYSKAPTYHKSKGWGWPMPAASSLGYGDGGYSSGSDHYAGAYSKHEPVASKYKLVPYDSYKASKGIIPGYGYAGSPPAVEDSYKSQDGEIYKGELTYHNFYPPGSVKTPEMIPQDPANTYYTSAYGGPGHEYTGILTHDQQDPAQDKSSEESGFLVDSVKNNPLESESSEPTATIAPNPLLEKYLEKRLEEEANKQKDVEQKQEAQQLIQMLRKAYLKQLVTSLKEEEQLGSVEAEFNRGSRSIENADKTNIIRNLLTRNHASKSEEVRMEERSSDAVNELLAQSPPAPITSSETSFVSSTERQKMTTSTERLSSTESPITSSENYIREPENYPSSTETAILAPEEPSAVESPPATSNSKESAREFPDFGVEMPAMWVKADNTFSNEESPFMIRVKRNSQANQEEEEVYDDAEVQPEARTSQEQQPPMNPDTEKQISAFVDDIKKFFTLLTVLDQDQCLQKLVCDVHTNQKDLSTITQYEQNILTTFKLMKALMPPGEEDSSTKYRRAALIGETGQSLELCQQTFSPCGFSSSQIITLGTQTEATPADWAAADMPQASARSDYVTLMPRVRRTLRSYYL